MAFSNADLSTDEQTWAADDKLLVTGPNLIAQATVAKWSATRDIAGTDATDSDGPVTRLYDGQTHFTSYPNASGTTWYMVFQFASPGIEFDTIAFVNHNIDDLGATVTVNISDASTFTSPTQISSWTPSTGARRIDLELGTGGTGQRYTDVQYLAVTIGGGSSGVPSFGEFGIYARTQLEHNPNRPWDPDAQTGSARRHVSESGVITDYVLHEGGRIMRAQLDVSDSTQQSNLKSWGQAIGVQSFLWVDEPETSPGSFLIAKRAKPEFAFPWDGPSLRKHEIVAREQGPHFLSTES